ncbi:hypothetical protein [Staphylococcus epidermidis]|uniref:hypothetical protein n=1 Tax=Staphylococcus epidermidis TaxID=1282 RepID=UPI001455CCDC|nr:hypothetical protein [Staphylococcus epidermidis]NLR08331.1 hypothetical protein [Staphylococcus epidermidis]
MKILDTITSVAAYVPPSGGSAPPGVDGLNTVVTWILWGASAVLFVLFIVGLVQAAQARNRGGQADASAPVWPLICAIIVGAAGTIWNAIA